MALPLARVAEDGGRAPGSAPPADGTIVIETPSGGRVIVAFPDPRAGVAAPLIKAATALTRADGPQGEIEGVIVVEALRLGLEAVVSGSRHPTTIVVQSRR